MSNSTSTKTNVWSINPLEAQKCTSAVRNAYTFSFPVASAKVTTHEEITDYGKSLMDTVPWSFVTLNTLGTKWANKPLTELIDHELFPALAIKYGLDKDIDADGIQAHFAQGKVPNPYVDFIESLKRTGVVLNGTRYYVTGICSGTKSGRLYAYPSEGRKYLSSMFPEPKDDIRAGALHSPGYEMIAHLPNVQVMIVKDDDPRFDTGDGQAIRNDLFADLVYERNPLLPKYGYKRNWQYRILAFDEKVAFKGDVKPDRQGQLPEDWPSLVVPMSAAKGFGLSTAKVGEWEVYPYLRFAVLEIAVKRPMAIGAQVSRYFPALSWSLYRRHWPVLAKHFHELAKDPQMLIFDKGPAALYDEEGRPDYMGALQALALLAEETGNTDILYHPGVIKDLSRILSDRMRMALNGFPTPPDSWMGEGSKVVPHGKVVLHPSEWEHATRTAVLGRMPCVGHLIVVEVVLDKDMGKGSIAACDSTFAATDGDADGDYYYLIPEGYGDWTDHWMRSIQTLPPGAKARGKGEAKSFGEKVSNMVGTTMGTDPVSQLSATLQQLVDLRFIVASRGRDVITFRGKPEEVKARKDKLWACIQALTSWVDLPTTRPPWGWNVLVPMIDRLIDLLGVQLQAAIDIAKHNSQVDWPLVDVTTSFMRACGLSWHDTVYRRMARGEIKAFTKAEKDVYQGKDVIFSKGEIIVPSKVCWDRTPLSRSWKQFGNMMPLIPAREMPVDHFINWLPAPDNTSEGAKWAEALWTETSKRLNALNAMPTDTDDDWDALNEAKSEIMREYGRENYLCDLPEDQKIEAARWQWHKGCTSHNATGTCWRYGLIREVISQLMEHRDRMEVVEGTVHGVVVGADFAKYMADRPQATFEVSLLAKGAKKYIVMTDKSQWLIDRLDAALERGGKFNIHVSKGTTTGAWPFQVNGVAAADPKPKHDDVLEAALDVVGDLASRQMSETDLQARKDAMKAAVKKEQAKTLPKVGDRIDGGVVISVSGGEVLEPQDGVVVMSASSMSQEEMDEAFGW